MRLVPALASFCALLVPSSAFAWGHEGHEVIALIARSYLTPEVRAKVDAILTSDTDTLTAPDIASRATWADRWRTSHRETADWHFADIELDAPDLKSACFGYPQPNTPASAGPAQDCIVDKIREFGQELADPNTAPAERVLALKYVLHFVGDVHQPLHTSDNHDKGGNCVLLSLGGARTVSLHSYWDTVLVEEQGDGAAAIAAELRADITPQELSDWQHGDAADWAMESFGVAKNVAYRLATKPGCSSDPAPLSLPQGYEASARAAARLQLERAGVRLARVLNNTLGSARAP